ncbi:hypothetical protein GQ54DRAFT_237787, partial [Martensiomyces pterosporus]
EDKWRRLGARVLPLFNGDRLQGTVEENNEIVRYMVEGLVNVWEMLFSHILPYIEGVFLPLLQFKVATVSNLDKATNIRQAVLSHFRDSIVVPLLGRLDDAAGIIRAQGAQGALGSQSVAILLQMLTILAS